MKTAASLIVCILSVLLVVGTVKAAVKPITQVTNAISNALNVPILADRGIRNE